MIVEKELLAKYNIPVPRYTSYPPANHFEDNFSKADYKKLIIESNSKNPEHIAFYIHIPFCRQICYYCGCNALRMEQKYSVESYIKALKKEIKLVSDLIDKKRKVSQIHYGGGTPNAIDVKFLQELNTIFYESFSFIENPEIAIECNPSLLDFNYLDKLTEAGFNRFSFGIQDFNREILQNVNRRPSAFPVSGMIQHLKDKNPSAVVNLDFIYGLPGQNPGNFSENIKKAIAIRPERLVTFSYAHVPWVKEHQKILDKKGLPSPDSKMEMFLNTYSQMKESGYTAIGLDHFALPNDELSIALEQGKLHRNFQGYCTKRTTGQVYAFGVSSISQLTDGYTQNTKDIKKYTECMEQGVFATEKGYKLSLAEKITREVITELMCNKKINWKHTAENFNHSHDELKQIVGYNEERLSDYESDKLLEFDNEGIKVTEKGSLFIRNIASEFDPALRKGNKKYSKSV